MIHTQKEKFVYVAVMNRFPQTITLRWLCTSSDNSLFHLCHKGSRMFPSFKKKKKDKWNIDSSDNTTHYHWLSIHLRWAQIIKTHNKIDVGRPVVLIQSEGDILGLSDNGAKKMWPSVKLASEFLLHHNLRASRSAAVVSASGMSTQRLVQTLKTIISSDPAQHGEPLLTLWLTILITWVNL